MPLFSKNKPFEKKTFALQCLQKNIEKLLFGTKKQLTGIDIGDIARVIAKRNNGINTIKNIQGKIHLIEKNWNYERLVAFLGILKILKVCTADSDAIPQIFTDYQKTLELMGKTISLDHCQLLQMRIFKHLGSLNPEFFEADTILKYMYQHICKTPLERIFQSRPLTEIHKKTIENSNLFALSTFLP